MGPLQRGSCEEREPRGPHHRFLAEELRQELDHQVDRVRAGGVPAMGFPRRYKQHIPRDTADRYAVEGMHHAAPDQQIHLERSVHVGIGPVRVVRRVHPADHWVCGPAQRLADVNWHTALSDVLDRSYCPIIPQLRLHVPPQAAAAVYTTKLAGGVPRVGRAAAERRRRCTQRRAGVCTSPRTGTKRAGREAISREVPGLTSADSGQVGWLVSDGPHDMQEGNVRCAGTVEVSH